MPGSPYTAVVIVGDMSTVGPQAVNGSKTPLVKKMLDDCRIAESPKLQAHQEHFSRRKLASEQASHSNS